MTSGPDREWSGRGEGDCQRKSSGVGPLRLSDVGTPVPGEGELRPVDPDERDLLRVLDSPTAGGRVIRGGALRVGTYAAGVSIGIVSAALMTRHLGVEDFGKYVIVTSLITIVAGLTEAGIPNVAARELATRTRDDRNELFANVLGIRLAIAVAGVAAATVFALAASYDSTMVIGTVLAGVGLLITTVQQTYAIPIGVQLRFGWLSTLDLLRQALFVAIVIVLVFAGAGLLPFFAATIPTSLLLLVLVAPLVRGTAPLLPRFERAEWLRILRLVGVYAAAAALGTMYVSAVIVTTSLVGTAEDSGYLGAAFRVFSVLGAIPLLLVSTAFPVLARAARTDPERLQYTVQRLIDVALIVGSWVALSTVLGAAFAIKVVAGSDFEEAVPVLQIQGVALFTTFLGVTGGLSLVSLHRHVALLIGNLVALSAVVVLTAVLVPEFGAEGAAVATLIADCGIVLLYGIVLFGGRTVHYDPELVPRVALAVGASVALALLPLGDVALVLLATLVYWSVLFVVRGVPGEVIDALLRREPRSGP
jgi:O-antigen/teichoic acid export membrane protein